MTKRILIADDSAFMRKRIREAFIAKGYEIVAEAQDGNEAFALYEKFKPDVVTMDVTMRGKDGLTATKEILQAWPEANIILLTMLQDDEYRNLALTVGAKAFVVKNELDKIFDLIDQLSVN